MKKNFLTVVLIIVGIIILLFIRTQYSDHNLKRTVSACMYAEKKIPNHMMQKKLGNIVKKKLRKVLKLRIKI